MKYIVTAQKTHAIDDPGARLVYIKVFLQIDGSWAQATRSPWSFPTPQAAANAWHANEFKSVGLGADQMPRIEGPHGGVYSINDGRLLK
jgi:hypothetical protein